MTVLMIIWSLAAIVLAGAFIVVALVVPQIGTMLNMNETMTISSAALLGAVVAIPIAFMVTKAILGNNKAA